MQLARWKRYVYGIVAAEISSFTRYYDRVVQWRRQRGDTGFLLEAIEAPSKALLDEAPDLRDEREQRTAILLNGTLNYDFDIQRLLTDLRARLARTSRVVAVLYNPYYSFIYRLARRLGLKAGDDPTTFVTYDSLRNIARLAGYDLALARPAVYSPFRLLGLGSLINRVMPMLPLLRHLGFVSVVVLRPIVPERERPSLSVIVPARNERGNIAHVLERLPDLGCELEVLFVEGHSSDGTWEEIQRVRQTLLSVDAQTGVSAPHLTVRAFQQTGKGKADAVRLAITQATCDLVTILDADLSMPPEMLGEFYGAWCDGHADFINGSRLVYPMEGEAMRLLNHLGNVFFAKALSFVLSMHVTDSLCGTKLAARHDLERMRRWRADFGDFDPFGDFELLFPASILALGTIDVPIRYRARTYGATNIRRFRDGLQLLNMTAIGLLRVRAGRIGR